MSGGSSNYHIPVLLDECMEYLAIKPDGTYLDGTMGGGGHSSAILQSLGEGGQLICLDRDQMAIEEGKQKLEKIQSLGHYQIVQSEFADFDKVLERLEVKELDGVLLDIGVSSAQLDIADRGFSYMQDGPLDMRMDQSQEFTAEDLINTASEQELVKILFDYGEERYARRIADRIVRERKNKRIRTSHELVDLIIAAMPKKARQEKQHPAKRSFQAFRIAVNDELGQLEAFLDKIPNYMANHGRILLISFHSLEDRIIKQAMRSWEDPCTCPANFPQCVCGKQSLGHPVVRKGVTASKAEEKDNPRSRSARLRIFEIYK